MKRNKAPGLDSMAPELFNRELIAFLARIFNTVFSTGIFPKAWSIYKKGDENLPGNYRGITLLPIMGKLLTSISDFGVG